MRGPERVLQAVALSVPPLRRARFLEEWQADLAAGRLLGLPPWGLVAAAGRVAVFLLWSHLRAELVRSRSRFELAGVGVGVGVLLVVVDGPVAVLVPFVVLVLVCWIWWRVGRWIDSGR